MKKYAFKKYHPSHAFGSPVARTRGLVLVLYLLSSGLFFDLRQFKLNITLNLNLGTVYEDYESSLAMDSLIYKDDETKSAIIRELENFGCCDLCILRYLGVTDPHVYRGTKDEIKKFLHPNDSGAPKEEGKDAVKVDNENCEQRPPKLFKSNPCSACLGLLDESHGTSEDVVDEIVKKVKEADFQTQSYTVNLSVPIAVQFRAYFVWNCLVDKFPSVYGNLLTMKPEGIGLKNVWKWVCTGRLRDKIDPDSEWVTEGCLMVTVTLKYEDDQTECAQLARLFKGTKSNFLSRGSIDTVMKDVSTLEFKRKYGEHPATASKFLQVEEINCAHVSVFIAGRYNKYSRNVSQTPWIVDGKKFHDGSVEELIAEKVLPMFHAESEKLIASGREDVDVRMLGRGRPFVMEVLNPKRTLFIQSDMNELRDLINKSTRLIQVRDLQLVDRKSAAGIKEGEEFKRKNYCALCRIPDGEVTPEIIEKLNSIPLPLVLQQKTPIRVLHRRSLMTRERSIYSLKAVAGTKSKKLFKLYVQTQAGTYVKELVHSDLGRTKPSIAEILGCDADIVSLDVEDVEFPWPPKIGE